MATNQMASVYQALVRMAHAQEKNLQVQRDSIAHVVDGLSLIQIHVLEYIDLFPRSNDAALIRSLNLPQASIEAAIVFLWDKGYIAAYGEDEQAQSQYHITDQGQLVLEPYMDLHNRAWLHYSEFLAQYDETTLATVEHFLNDMTDFLKNTQI